MDIVPAERLGTHPVLSALGPEPLSRDFDGFVLARACKGKNTLLKAALLDQHVVAGLGNIYASEALHLARRRYGQRRQSPRRPTAAPISASARRCDQRY